MEGHTNISTDPSEDVPPAMQLEQETPRHPDRAPRLAQPGTGVIVDIPDGIAGDENHYSALASHLLLDTRRTEARTRAPRDNLAHFALHDWIRHAMADDGSRLRAHEHDHDAKEDGVADDLVGVAVPDGEEDEEGGEEEALEDGRAGGVVVGVNAVQDGGGGEEHGEVVGWAGSAVVMGMGMGIGI